MPTSTTNFGWQKPNVNDPVDADLWGGYLNTNLDMQDALVKTLQNVTSLLTASEQTIASAATTDLGSLTSVNANITGTTAITSFGTVAAGTPRNGRFSGVLILTHNATGLILPSNANIVTAANDRFSAISLGSGNWLVTDYVRADGTSIVKTTLADIPTTLAGVSATQAVTPAGFAGSLVSASTYGSAKFPGGVWVQWGQTNSAIANSTVGITFPSGAFGQPPASVVLTPQRGAIANDGVSLGTVTSSTFQIRIGSTAVTSVHWIAIGNI